MSDETLPARRGPGRPPLTPEQRAARLQEGRTEARADSAENGGRLLDSPFAPPTLAQLEHYLGFVDESWVKENVQGAKLGGLAQVLKRALEAVAIVDQRWASSRNAEFCSVCQKPFTNGRFVAERSWMDPMTNNIKTLRSCSEACTREIERIARSVNDERQGLGRPQRV